MKNNTVIDLSTYRSSCQNCGLFKLCLPLKKPRCDIEKINSVINRSRIVEHGDYLFREYEPFTTIYAIRTGSFKTCSIIENGNEQVTGFHFPDELLGINAISKRIHTESAVALETSSVCEIPFDKLDKLCKKNTAMQHFLLNAMSNEIQHDHCQLAMISRMSAEARLASFLLSLSYHFQQRGFSATEFNLSMTRTDIANFLGLAVETVSRLLSRFQREGLLTVNRRYFALYDIEGLMRIAPKCSSLSYPSYSLSNKAS